MAWQAYRFVGGPVDGQEREVQLWLMNGREVAPRHWVVIEPTPLPEPSACFDGGAATREVAHQHTYRFIENGDARNGHYEWMEG